MSDNIPKYVFAPPSPLKINYIIAIVMILLTILYSIYTILSYDVNNPINNSLTFSRTLDILMLFIVILTVIPLYYITAEEKKCIYMNNALDKIEIFVKKPKSIVMTLSSIIILYAVIFISSIPMSSETKSLTITISEILLWSFLIFILFTQTFTQIFDTNLTDSFFKFLKSLYNVIEIDPKDVIKIEKIPEVFHVSNNLYNYEEAQSICKSFDSRLATYDEIEKSYNNGAEFCGYGWSEGQMILFPTQKKTFDKLQLIPGRQNECGRTGVNGGFNSNPTMQFGVNCFGIKKEGVNPKEKELLLEKKIIQSDIMDAKVKYWQDHKDEMLVIDSFNKSKWSEY